MSDLSTPWADLVQASDWLDAMAVPAWLYREGQAPRGNPPLLRLLHLDDLERRHPHDLAAPAHREALAAATAECLHGSGQPPALPAELLSSDGSLRPVELTLRRVRWGGGDAALVTCQDLSDFQHVQHMMLGMSSLLRQIVDGAPVASFVIDSNHRVTHWNTACERLTGRGADEMIGSTEAWRAFYDEPRLLIADAIVDGLPLAELQQQLADVQASSLVAGALEKEAWFGNLGSEGRWLNFTAAPLRNAQGEVTGAIVTLQDVSQRRRTEEELTRRLELLVDERSAELAASARAMDAFIDNAPIGVVYADRGRVLRSNRRMAEIFGPADPAGAGADSGRHFYFAPDDEVAMRKLAGPALAAGQPLHHEMWMHHRSGRAIWTQINAYRVEGGTTAWWMLQDRTEVRAAQQEVNTRLDQLQATNQKLEQAQNQLLQSEKMASIGQLAAGVAHEINNPVGFVSSNLHTLRQYVAALLNLVDAQAAAHAAPADAQLVARLAAASQAAELDYLKEDLPQLLDESEDGLARVKKIVQDLKDFSRVDQSDWQQADLNAGLESTLNVVRNEVKYKAEVVKNLGSLPLVLCLAGQINQVFMNLIVNASHAIEGQGLITLSSGVEPDWVWLQVDDTGCGMGEDVLRRIFEPFFTTKDVGKGTGLGLSLSFSIVQRHGGEIQVRSQPGKGSSFRVWLPVEGPASHVGGERERPPPWGPAT
jgi:two-component system, NtrC family, sensor kinase